MTRRSCILGTFIISIVATFTMSGEGRQALQDGKSEQIQQAQAKRYTYTVDDKKVTVDFPVFVEGNDKKVTKDIFRGYQLYNSYCYRCHGTDATTSELAPDLRRFVEAERAQQTFMAVAMASRSVGMRMGLLARTSTPGNSILS